MNQRYTNMGSGQEFAGSMTQYLVGYLRDHVGPDALDEVLRLAGESRDAAEISDPAVWSSYWQFRRLLEATATVLIDPARITEAAAIGAWDIWSTPEVITLLQVLGSPGALYADISLSASTLTAVADVQGEEVGPTEWTITSQMIPEFEPFREFCLFAAGLFSTTPMPFGFAPATVVEETCQCDGAPACRFRILWNATGDLGERTRYLETRTQVLDTRLEVLQRTLVDLVSNESLDEVLTTIVESAARAVTAPGFVLALNALPWASQHVYAEGLEDDEARRVAVELLASGPPQRNHLVVDVASRRRNYGRLAAIRPNNEAFYPQELRILEAYGRVAAAALDSATAVAQARQQATTARVLMELSRSLAEVVTTDEMALRVARAVPALIDCDRAVLVLCHGPTATAYIAGSHGFPAEDDAALRSSTLPPPPPEEQSDQPADPDHRSDSSSEFTRVLAGGGAVGALTVPIRRNGQLLGWVNAAVIEDADRLACPDVEDRLNALAEQVAAAISHASLLDQIRHQALHDGLTGLPNRALILDRVEQMLTRARRQRTPAAAMFIDLDGFKDINDTFGHGTGDQLLRAVAVRLATTLRESDSIGRLGGDEFVVLAEGISTDAGPELVAGRLLDVLREPFVLDGWPQDPFTITASVGVAMGDRPSASELLRDADVALYAAKAAGKNRYVLFEPEMQTAVQARLALETDLRGALAARQFFLLYQPILNLASRGVTGVEALLRWRHPTRGVVQPDNFIPLLEETGMIVDIGRWVLEEACRQAAKWHDQGQHLDMAVNVSARQLDHDEFVVDVETALDRSGLDPASLVIEITETTIMRDAQATARRLRSIKSLGVRVSIDDFGTGYSSLAYLRQFPVDSLKIDRSFVSGYANSPDAEALIHSLVQLGKAMGLETIAEGIEEEDQFVRLQVQQCDSGQGYLFARPLDADALEALLASQTVNEGKESGAAPLAVVNPGGAAATPAEAPATAFEESLDVPRSCRTRLNHQSLITAIDDATTQLLGWSPEQMVGQHFSSFIHPDDRPLSVTMATQIAGAVGAKSRARLRHKCSDGSWRWMEVTNHNLLAAPTQPCLAVEMADIAGEMAALERVRAREELLNRLGDALPVGVLQLDTDRRIVRTNSRLHQIMAVERGTTIEEQLASVIDADRAALHQALDTLFQDGGGLDLDVRLQLADDADLRQCKISLRALNNDRGEVAGAIMCVTDVTESVRMRRELERSAMLA